MHIRKAGQSDVHDIAKQALTGGPTEHSGCSASSIKIFDPNEGALRLYQRPGYSILHKRRAVPHERHPYDGPIVLLTRRVAT